MFQPRNNYNGVFGGKFHLYMDDNIGVLAMNWKLTADEPIIQALDCFQEYCLFVSISSNQMINQVPGINTDPLFQSMKIWSNKQF